jgi:hypothetical protein
MKWSLVLVLLAPGCGSDAVLRLLPNALDAASVEPAPGADADAETWGNFAEAGFDPSPESAPADASSMDRDAALEPDAAPLVDATLPACFPPWLCGPCSSDATCRDGPFVGRCDLRSSRCVECLSNADCELDKACDPVALTCK